MTTDCLDAIIACREYYARRFGGREFMATEPRPFTSIMSRSFSDFPLVTCSHSTGRSQDFHANGLRVGLHVSGSLGKLEQVTETHSICPLRRLLFILCSTLTSQTDSNFIAGWIWLLSDEGLVNEEKYLPNVSASNLRTEDPRFPNGRSTELRE